MDALGFLKERKRICNYYSYCSEGCPLEGTKCTLSSSTSDKEFEKIITAVEQWSKKHPYKTRQSVFLEQYPEARIGDDGVLQIYPCSISSSHRNARGNCATMGRECPDRCREFWMQEVE